MTIEISIIVPVYNTEKYLKRCLDSIFSQEFSAAFEVIAVDDCSTDNSLMLLNDYCSCESRLFVIKHDSNKKLSKARSTGMKAAKGKYIMHIDSDDWILPNTLKRLHNVIVDKNVDVVIFNYLRENNLGKKYVGQKISNSFKTTNKLSVQKYFYGAAVNKIIKKDLTKSLIYEEQGLNSTEDLLYSTEILLKSNNIYVLHESYYVYFVNTRSITATVGSLKYFEDQLLVISQLQKIFLKYNADNKFIRNVLNYFDKWILMEFAKIYLLNHEMLEESRSLIKKIYLFPIFTNTHFKKIEKALSSKFYCLLEVTRLTGIRFSLLLILQKVYKEISYQNKFKLS